MSTWNRGVPGRVWETASYTLVELMITVVIVAILAMAAIPIYRSSVAKARVSEGIAGVGTIRTSFRVYSALHNGNYPVYTAVDGDGLSQIGVEGAGLEGRFHGPEDYEVTSDATTYTIKVTNPDTGLIYETDQDGTETTGEGYFTSGY